MATSDPHDHTQATQTEQAEEVEEIDIDPVLDGEDDAEEDELDSLDDEMFDPLQHLTQLLVTEDGMPIVDVLQSIHRELGAQTKELNTLNKILYKWSSSGK